MKTVESSSSAPAREVDVAVIGGGPGGSAAALALARRGRTVALFEREAGPRFHIGESLLPRNSRTFQKLGIEADVEAQGFVPKWGATFATSDGTISTFADFSAAAEVDQPRAWQVRRSTFDSFLLDRAAAGGAAIHSGWQVKDVEFDETGVTLGHVSAEGASGTTRAKVVVDASGRKGLVISRFATRIHDPRLDNIAVHAQFTGIPRREGRRAGDIRMFTRRDPGWVWLIPLDKDVTSVGVVLPKKLHAASGQTRPAEALTHYLSKIPGAQPLFAEAKCVSETRFDADYSYVATQHAGDRWLAVGDAGAFLDPVFSTGVLLAMDGGIAAAEAIDSAISAGDCSRARFRAFERGVRQRYDHFHRYVVGFYDPAFRALFFHPQSRLGTYEAVMSILAGNWKPSVATRLRLALFFTLVGLQRRFKIVDDSSVMPAPEGEVAAA